MQVLVSDHAVKRFTELRVHGKADVYTALNTIALAESFTDLRANAGQYLRILTHTSDSSDIAYREAKAPLFEYRFRDVRLVFTVTATDRVESIVILTAYEKPTDLSF